MFLSLFLLAAILWAKKAKGHSPAVSIYLDVQLWGNLTIEITQHLLGWQSSSYTVIYDVFTMALLIASGIVVWEAWNISPSSQKA